LNRYIGEKFLSFFLLFAMTVLHSVHLLCFFFLPFIFSLFLWFVAVVVLLRSHFFFFLLVLSAVTVDSFYCVALCW
jgi:hypothetical protein